MPHQLANEAQGVGWGRWNHTNDNETKLDRTEALFLNSLIYS